MVTIADAVKLTNLSRQTIMRRIEELKIPTYRKPGTRKGSRLWVDRSDILKLLDP